MSQGSEEQYIIEEMASILLKLDMLYGWEKLHISSLIRQSRVFFAMAPMTLIGVVYII